MENMGSLKETITSIYGNDVRILRRLPVSGGDINRAYALELSDGSKLFMKVNAGKGADFFTAEAEGLSAIRQTGMIRAPEVIATGEDADGSFLLLEYIESGHRSKASSEELGRNLAMMHMADTDTFVQNGRFGFAGDNYIGSNPQINTAKENWTDFFIQCRLIPQFKRAASYFDREERRNNETFLERVDRYLAEPEYPSLIHGDLWAGNYMIDNAGKPWLIDPAAYVGNAEADLAMTELFGGFDRIFYDAYRDIAGIDPGYHDRKDLYNLYHLLNHLNLFGGGYLYSVRSIIRRFI